MRQYKQYTLRISCGTEASWERVIDAIDDDGAIAHVERHQAHNPFYTDGARLELFGAKECIARWGVEVQIVRIGTIGFPCP